MGEEILTQFITLRVSEPTYEVLKKKAREQERTISWIVRKILEEHVDGSADTE